MRTAFFKALVEAAEADDRIFLVVGDVGFGVVELFANRFPERFLNAGIAEQSMAGISAGLALSGRSVFMYSIANFPTLRCVEQIRNDICYHEANVKVVSVGGGFVYGALGPSHHATEDLAFMRALPGMTVVAPADPLESSLATRALASSTGPGYLRLGRAGEPAVHPGAIDFEIGRAVTAREGRDITLISTGGVLGICLEAAAKLTDLSVRVLSMHTLKPVDRGAILAAASETRGIVTVEEHSVIGGLGSAVAETLCRFTRHGVPMRMVGIEDRFCHEVGAQAHLRAACEITSDRVATAARELFLDQGVHDPKK